MNKSSSWWRLWAPRFRLSFQINCDGAQSHNDNNCVTVQIYMRNMRCTHSIRSPSMPLNMLPLTDSRWLAVRWSSATEEAPSNAPSSISEILLLLKLLEEDKTNKQQQNMKRVLQSTLLQVQPPSSQSQELRNCPTSCVGNNLSHFRKNIFQ